MISSKKTVQVTFLLDPTNNWIEEMLRNEHRIQEIDGYFFKIEHDHTKVADQDVVFILGYTRILDRSFLDLNHINLVVHESDLPEGKGFSPVQWQILEGKNAIPICLIEAGDKVDTGDIILKSTFTVSPTDLYDEIRLKQAKASFDLMFNFLVLYPDFQRESQSGKSSFYNRRTQLDGELDIDKSIREQFDLLRIGNNEDWPSFFFINGEKFVVKIYNG
jgi:methionyl-tRNA formyltransferase